MLYRTLHWYIFRELLRVFLMTASALTTLLAFGGTFRPFTRQGIDISQLMVIMLNLMPAMLAYAIPIAALFAAVLVYWRMSTDNELTACRAGGISFVAIVIPAFILGLVVASVDLGFVNYVVPQYLQRTERAVMRDLGSLIYSQIGRQEIFRYGKLAVYADSAELLPSDTADRQVVKLYGMAASMLEPGKTGGIVVAREATLTITSVPGQDSAAIDISLTDATGFDSTSFRRLAGSTPSLTPDGKPIPVPSWLKSKPKFLNHDQLMKLNDEPWGFPPVADAVGRIEAAHRYEAVAVKIVEWWQSQNTAGKPLTLEQPGVGTAVVNVSIYASSAQLTPTDAPDRQIVLRGKPGLPVKVEESMGDRVLTTLTCESVEVMLSSDELSGGGVGATLKLAGSVRKRSENVAAFIPQDGPEYVTGLVLPAPVRTVAPADPMMLISWAQESPSGAVQKMVSNALDRMQNLKQTIGSELHSRGSFSLSCLTLVLLGAALGILLRGRNPLAVFVVGFVPAVFLVLLITAGRELAEGDPKTVSAGISLIWAGNAMLLVIVSGVYAKLLRQ